jgi:hypothetical protein
MSCRLLRNIRAAGFACVLACSAICCGGAEPVVVRLPVREGPTHGFPVLRDSNGVKLADGEFTQQVENDRLRIKLVYTYAPNHRIEENAVLRQEPELIQEEWSWQEIREGAVIRNYTVDFANGQATVRKSEKTDSKPQAKDLKIEPGRTFAGFGFTLALVALRERLIAGETVELRAVGFTPQPRLVTVEISYVGLDEMKMAGRLVSGAHFLIHPKIPGIVRVFLKAPDNHLWLIHPGPAGFLRSEGPLIEPKDQIVRVDLLPGEPSGPATPIRDSKKAGGL